MVSRIGRNRPPTTGKVDKKPAKPKKPKVDKPAPKKPEGWKPGRPLE